MHSGWRSPVGPAMSAKASLSVEMNAHLLRAQVVFIGSCGYCLSEAELRNRCTKGQSMRYARLGSLCEPVRNDGVRYGK